MVETIQDYVSTAIELLSKGNPLQLPWQPPPHPHHTPLHISLDSILDSVLLGCHHMITQSSSVRALLLAMDTPTHIRKFWNTSEEAKVYP